MDGYALEMKRPVARAPRVPNGVLGMSIFVISEIMFFAGLISAHTITRASAPAGVWPPPGQPRLPIEATAINTLVLLLSGVALVAAVRALRAEQLQRAIRTMGVALLLGAWFVIAQGIEWVALIGEGLTMTSSAHGGFFYLIVGLHGLHAIIACAALGASTLLARRGTLTLARLRTVQVFWLFVVGLWPVLYWQVYLT